MTTYNIFTILLICGSMIFEGLLGRQFPLIQYNKRRIIGEKLYYVICCIVMISIVALRADFWTDSFGYTRIFNTVKGYGLPELVKNYSILKLTNGGEILFLTFTKIVTLFTNDTHIYFAIIALITYIPIVAIIYKKAECPFLSLLILYAFGFYFSSFNVIRSCMAFGVSCLLIDDIINKKTIRYIVFAVILSLFHTGAILLIPVYFVLQIPLLDKKHIIITMIGVIAFAIGYEYLLSVFDKFLYGSFYTGNRYSGINTTSGSVGMIVPSLLVLLLLMLFGRQVDSRDSEARVLINGTLIWCILSISVLGMRIMTRLSDMMFIYPVLFIPRLLLYISPEDENRVLLQRVIVFGMFILFALWRLHVSLKDSPFNPYMTFFS